MLLKFNHCHKLLTLVFMTLWHIKQKVVSESTFKECDGDNIIENFRRGQHYQYSDHCSINKVDRITCQQSILDSYLDTKKMIKLCKYEYNISTIVDIDYIGLLNDISVIYISQDNYISAKEVLMEALEYDNFPVNVIANLAITEANLNNIRNAIDLYINLMNHDPNNSVYHYNLGQLFFRTNLDNDRQTGKELLLTAVAINPKLYSSWYAVAVQECGNYDNETINISQMYFSKAIKESYHSGDMNYYWTVLFQSVGNIIPTIIIERNFIESIRLEYILGLHLINKFSTKDIFLQSNLKTTIGCSSFGYYAIYQGKEDIYIRSLFAYTYWRLFHAELSFNTSHIYKVNNTVTYSILPISNKENSGSYLNLPNKIKVGFLSVFFYHHSVGLLLSGVIKNINREIFEVYVIHLSSADHSDYLTEDLKNSNNNIIFKRISSTDVSKVRSEILSLSLDVLVFGEIGMDSLTYFLSFTRLAKRSAVFWGHAVTSGVSERMFQYMENNLNGKQDYDALIFDIINKTVSDKISNSSESSNHPINIMNEMIRNRDLTNKDENKIIGDINIDSFGGPDYYISSVLFESNSIFAQYEYTERLILMDSLTTYFYRPKLPYSSFELSLPVDILNCTNNSNITIKSDIIIEEEYNRVIPINLKRFMESKIWTSVEDVKNSIPINCHAELDLNNQCDSSDGIVSWVLPNKLDYLIYLSRGHDSSNIDKILDYLRFVCKSKRLSTHIYSIPQTLYKLHPDFDIIIKSILLTDELAIITIPISISSSQTKLVVKRLSKFISEEILSNRILFVRQMNEREYLTFCSIADVILDPFPVGGGRSSFEIFSVGTPIITLFNRTSILQLTNGMYKVMGKYFYEKKNNNSNNINIPQCCVVDTFEDYINLSVNIVKNITLLNEIRSDIYSRADYLYENNSVIDEWNRLLLYISITSRPIPNPKRLHDLQNLANDSLFYKESFSFLTNNFNDMWTTKELELVWFNYALPAIRINEVNIGDQ